MRFLTVLFAASAVEAFTAFLIPCRELKLLYLAAERQSLYQMV
jgi:hypothetical protein